MIKGCLLSVFFLAFLCIEVLLVQWLLGLFGWHFGFWTTLGIMFVVDLLLSGLKK